MATTKVTAAELDDQFRGALGYRSMPDGWTPVGAWLRVSGDSQDERNQISELIGHCVKRKYWIAKWYPVHAKSAYKGEHQADLDIAVEDMRDGLIQILVIPHSNRLERRKGKMGTELLNTLSEFVDAGGKVESVEEPTLGNVDIPSRTMTYMTGLMNTEKSETISRETRRAHNRIDANHGVKNRIPGVWYTYKGPKYDKHPVPTDICREYWPKVLMMCIAGDSATKIAAWLDSEGVKTQKGGKWNAGTILHLIHNPIFCGRRLGWRPGTPLLEDEAVVGVDIWEAAQDALFSRPKRGPVAENNRPMLATLKCIRCGSPMYRKKIGGRISRRYVYRCEGRGPQRKGCGNITPYHETETIVALQIFAASTDMHREKTWVKGVNWDAEIADTLQQIKALNPLDLQDEKRRPELIEELREFQRKNEEEATPGGWQLTETDITEGKYFLGLDADGRREYLKSFDIRVEKVTGPEGQTGIHVVIDGTDYGVWAWRYHSPASDEKQAS